MPSGRLDYPFVQSPNFSSRRGKTATAIVIHYTGGGDADGSISWLCNPQSKASAHFVISRSGDIRQLVDLECAAWHAGVSEMEVRGSMVANCNWFTIGVELANHGYLQKLNGDFFYEVGRSLKKYRREPPKFGRLEYDNGQNFEGWFEPYPDAQIDALQGLLAKLSVSGWREAAQNLIGHEEIALPLGRKQDPGPLFPWNRFLRQVDMRTRAHRLPEQLDTSHPG